MPERKTLERARQHKREGKAPTTQAGEFVREEIEHIREGKHGARSAAQAITIGLSKARRAGVDLPPPEKGKASEETRLSAKRALKAGDKPAAKPSRTRSKATLSALKREGSEAASYLALERHAKAAAKQSAYDIFLVALKTAACRTSSRSRASTGTISICMPAIS